MKIKFFNRGICVCIGITTFSPLAQGLLTGKYRKGQPLPAVQSLLVKWCV